VAIDLDRLPMAYHLAEWPMAELPDAGEARREDVCRALLRGVRSVVPETVGLRIVRNEQRMVSRDGAWVAVGDREPVHVCDGEAAGP
jgi:hypothetical protein